MVRLCSPPKMRRPSGSMASGWDGALWVPQSPWVGGPGAFGPGLSATGGPGTPWSLLCGGMMGGAGALWPGHAMMGGASVGTVGEAVVPIHSQSTPAQAQVQASAALDAAGAFGPGLVAAPPRPTVEQVRDRAFNRAAVVAALREHFPLHWHSALGRKWPWLLCGDPFVTMANRGPRYSCWPSSKTNSGSAIRAIGGVHAVPVDWLPAGTKRKASGE